MVEEIAKTVFSLFQPFTSGDAIVLSAPTIPVHLVKSLVLSMKEYFIKESTVLKIDGTVRVIGDLHGHLYNLYHILSHFKVPSTSKPSLHDHIHFADMPSRSFNRSGNSLLGNISLNNNSNNNNNHSGNDVFKYLFLGDMIDRGINSIQTIALIFALKILQPDNVFIIRGNHESAKLSKTQGFYSDIMVTYQDEELYNDFVEVFELIPLIAVVNKTTFCVHGGINEKFMKLEQVESINRPLSEKDYEIVEGLLWSDPTDKTDQFEESHRGVGRLFGVKAFNEFMANNNFRYFIRGHECVQDGISYMFDERLITVFSASEYCGFIDNRAGVLTIDQSNAMSTYTFSIEELVNECYAVRPNENRTNKKFSFNRSLNKINFKDGHPWKGSPYVRQIMCSKQILTSRNVINAYMFTKPKAERKSTTSMSVIPSFEQNV